MALVANKNVLIAFTFRISRTHEARA